MSPEATEHRLFVASPYKLRVVTHLALFFAQLGLALWKTWGDISAGGSFCDGADFRSKSPRMLLSRAHFRGVPGILTPVSLGSPGDVPVPPKPTWLAHMALTVNVLGYYFSTRGLFIFPVKGFF